MNKFTIILTIVSLLLAVSYMVLDSLARKDWMGSSPVKIYNRLKINGIKSKKQCLTNYRNTYKECKNEFCYNKSITYAAICLRGSKGDKKKFCTDNWNFGEKYTSLMDKVDFCGTLGIDPPHCDRMHSTLANYCE